MKKYLFTLLMVIGMITSINTKTIANAEENKDTYISDNGF